MSDVTQPTIPTQPTGTTSTATELRWSARAASRRCAAP